MGRLYQDAASSPFTYNHSHKLAAHIGSLFYFPVVMPIMMYFLVMEEESFNFRPVFVTLNRKGTLNTFYVCIFPWHIMDKVN